MPVQTFTHVLGEQGMIQMRDKKKLANDKSFLPMTKPLCHNHIIWWIFSQFNVKLPINAISPLSVCILFPSSLHI